MKRASLAAVLLALSACAPADEPAVPSRELPVVRTAGGVEMALVPEGDFEMGSARGRDEEKPVHKVHLDAFLMDRTEVTQEQYEKHRLPNPSRFKGPTLPVEMITWMKAAAFCNVRSRAEGLEPCYNEDTAECDFSKSGYRLPTEAEWEYACRAGTKTDYSFGGEGRRSADYAWFADNAEKRTHPVGQKKPNPWGLYDMHGNVAEWCNDIFAKDAYATAAAANPRGPKDGEMYVLRGGSWKGSAEILRSFHRVAENPGFSDACLAPDTMGFRCVRRPDPPKAAAGAKTTLPTGFVSADIYLQHKTGNGFPERPERLEAIVKRLTDDGCLAKMTPLSPVASPLDALRAVHRDDYIERVKKICGSLGDGIGQVDSGDVPVSAKSYEAALAAAGGVLAAVDAVMDGKVRNAFCAVRPPGHHAGKDKAMGFCLFNNAAIAARHLLNRHKLGKVLIVDWDVHHGNGTQDEFYEDGRVMYFSTHLAAPFSPGTGSADEKGKGAGQGCIVNVPLEKGSGDDVFRKVYEDKLKPAALAFKPDFILISAGFDSARGDVLGRLDLTPDGYAFMTKTVREIADACCKGRIVSMLEGGYNLEALAASVEAHVRALME